MQNDLVTRPLSPDRLPGQEPSTTWEKTCPTCRQSNRSQANYCRMCGAALTSEMQIAPRQLQPGMFLEGRYRVIRQIGEGGLGRAFLSVDHSGRRYVLKQIRQPGNEDEVENFDLYLQSFQREANILSSLPHPYLPIARDFIITPNNFVIVMDYIEGQTLAEVMEAADGPLSEDEVLHWGIQVCEALSYLHSKRPPIIHRNIKPKNIMLEAGDAEKVRLIGFGLARFYIDGLDRDEDNLGTHGYAPPEQYGSAQTDARSDIFSLGATLFTLLSRRDPGDFVARSPDGEIVLSFPSLTEVNPQVSLPTAKIIQKALQADRDRRFQSAQEMKAALEEILHQKQPAEGIPEKFTFGQPVPLEETRFCEFKEIKGNNPLQSILHLVEQYTVAFLNSDGGRILWGIRDEDRVVVGVALSYRQRDQIRRGVLDKMMRIQPAVSPSAYHINFHPVAGVEKTREDEELYVVEVVVPRPQTHLLYFTEEGEVYVKTDAGKKRLSGSEIQDEIMRRLQKSP